MKLSWEGAEDRGKMSKIAFEMASPEGESPAAWGRVGRGRDARQQRLYHGGGLIVITCPTPPPGIIIGQGLDQSNEYLGKRFGRFIFFLLW
jgi:hypothetical protein